MQTCVCGAENPDNARFCSACGKGLGKPLCRSCGAENAVGSRFCTACGASLSPPVTPTPPPVRRGPWVSPYDFSWDMVWKPADTLNRARGLASLGVIASGIMAAATVIIAFVTRENLTPTAFQFQFVIAFFYTAFAYWTYKGAVIGSLLAIALYAVNMIAGLYLVARRGGIHGDIPLVQVLVWIGMYVGLPAAFVSGVRGCLAWARLRRPPY